MSHSHRIIIFSLCVFVFIIHAGFSVHSRSLKAAWANVPPVPTEKGATILAVGDQQLAYRVSGIMIQNMGDTGGETTPLYKYDYDRLGQWFFLTDALDRRSNFMPLLAAYYFGGTQEPKDLDPVIDYLAMVGQRSYDEKWRWLAQAVYLSRFRQHDLDKAMGLAYMLANMKAPDMPAWTRQMPAFIAAAQGDKETSYRIIMSILKETSAELHPNEVNFMVHYICERTLDELEAAQHPLCIAQKQP